MHKNEEVQNLSAQLAERLRDHLIIMHIQTIYKLDAEARCLRKIETRGVVECGIPSIARALPTCPESFNSM